MHTSNLSLYFSSVTLMTSEMEEKYLLIVSAVTITLAEHPLQGLLSFTIQPFLFY
ncbi:hypothetical protein ABFG93_16670 [Pseudalkalibacillus hwajinpoensis]|uniref:hypothetical protein n=1 Tax=Guptibacillus hwajinpoensis TaxID=208199 RepID=UPI00325B4CB7